MDLQSVAASHNRRYDNGDYLFGHPVELALLYHDRFDFIPVCLQISGFCGHHLIEVGDEIDTQLRLDLLIDFLDSAPCFFLGDHLDGRHGCHLL